MAQRILVLTTSYPRTLDDDAGIFVARLVEALAKLGAKCEVLVPLDSKEAQFEERGQILIRRYRYGLFAKGKLAFGAGSLPNLRKNPFLIFQAPFLIFLMAWHAILLRKNYDLIQANWMPSAVAAWICSLFTGKKYLVTLRGEDVKLLKIVFLKPLFFLVLNSAKKIISVNEHFIETVKKLYGINESKISYIPNGVEVVTPTQSEIERFATEQELNLAKKYLLFVGRIIPLKRVDLLIKLMSNPALKNFELIVCGPQVDQDYLDQIKSIASELKVQHKLLFVNKLAPSKINLILACSRFYVSASEYEGRSNSVLEAMAAGKVVFLSDILGHKELVRDGESGLLFNCERLDDLASKIVQVDQDQALYNQLSAAAKNSVAQFSWDACAKKYLSQFE